MLGADAWVVQPGRDRVRLPDLPVLVLEEQRLEAVQYPDLAVRGTGTALDGAGSTNSGATTVMWTPNSSTNNEWTISGV